MKLGIQTSRLPGQNLDEKFDAAVRNGFDAVEVNVGPDFDLNENFDDLLRARDGSGLPVCAICTHSIHDPLVPDQNERKRRFAVLTGLIQMTDELGANGVITVPVRPPHDFPKFSDRQRDLQELAVAAYRDWALACHTVMKRPSWNR